MGLHDPRVYGYTDTVGEKQEMYYTCLYCPYGFWDYLVKPPQYDMGKLSEYKLTKPNSTLRLHRINEEIKK